MNNIIKQYIEKITEQDIYNYALNEGVILLEDECKIIYMYLKNYYQVFLNDDPTFIFEELKDKLRKETYNKLVEIYNKYKNIYK